MKAMNMKMMRVAVQMDAFDRLDAPEDTTLAMMRGALRRGAEIFVYQPNDMSWKSEGSGALTARGAFVAAWDDPAKIPQLAAPSEENLAGFDVVLLRQDPPFDMAYITSTYLLELIADQVLIVNDPRAVRDAPEKLFIARWPDLMPPTLVSGDAASIAAFLARHGDIVLKPLYSYGGKGVVRLGAQAPETAIVDYLRDLGGLPCVAQKFIPEIVKGDKRVLLVDGQIAAAYSRVPKAGEFRVNIGAGAHIKPCEIAAEERAVIARFSGELARRGILFAAIDLMAGLVGEINVTSPAGFFDANTLYGLQGADRMEEKFWNMIEGRLAKKRAS
ncbi:MAG: glutathione synthase [Alphaproteobacteria bacterium]